MLGVLSVLFSIYLRPKYEYKNSQYKRISNTCLTRGTGACMWCCTQFIYHAPDLILADCQEVQVCFKSSSTVEYHAKSNHNQLLHTFTVICPRILDNSSFPLTRSGFCFPTACSTTSTGHSLYILPSITHFGKDKRVFNESTCSLYLSRGLSLLMNDQTKTQNKGVKFFTVWHIYTVLPTHGILSLHISLFHLDCTAFLQNPINLL